MNISKSQSETQTINQPAKNFFFVLVFFFNIPDVCRHLGLSVTLLIEYLRRWSTAGGKKKRKIVSETFIQSDLQRRTNIINHVVPLGIKPTGMLTATLRNHSLLMSGFTVTKLINE